MSVAPERMTSQWGGPTRWSVILRASGRSAANTADDAAWRNLIERYRAPIEAAIRRRVRGTKRAKDVADDFFSYLFEKSILAKSDPSVGRFRCYVQGVLARFLKHYSRSTTVRDLTLDDDAPLVDRSEVEDLESNEESEWAAQVLEHAIHRLLERKPRDGQLLLESYGVAPFKRLSSHDLCAREKVVPNALHQAVHRAKRELRAQIEAEIRETVVSKKEWKEETALTLERLAVARPALLELSSPPRAVRAQRHSSA